jgi:NADH-quinone oxidoreductase subunit M
MLTLLIVIPIVLAVAIALAPERFAKSAASFGSLAFFALTLVAGFGFDWSRAAEFQLSQSVRVTDGLTMALAVDSVSMLLILLTGILAPLCVFGSFAAIKSRPKTYYAWLIALQAPIVGAFAARDIVTFYVSFEFTLAPLFVLIMLFGSTNRRKAAIKFFLYTFTGSLLTLVGLIYVMWFNATRVETGSFEGAGEWSFMIATLQQASVRMGGVEQAWVLLALVAGFAVKTPMFPVHTWLPLAHTEAPTAGSVVLAGVLLKLGTYGLYRFVLPFVPDAVVEYAPFISILAIIGILYAGLICWVQRDVKKLVAYSSVSHLGFCVLALFALNEVGQAGSVLYMINHGLSTGALFFCIGFMYDRLHTRSMDELGGLAKSMPIWAFFMVFFSMASVGLPGLNGFVSEIMCVMAAYQSGATWGVGGTAGPLGPWFAVFAGLGMIVGAIYLLYMVGAVVWGPPKSPHDHHHGHAHDDSDLPTDLNAREVTILATLAFLCLWIGLYPKPLLNALEAPAAANIAFVEQAIADKAAAERVALVEEVRP